MFPNKPSTSTEKNPALDELIESVDEPDPPEANVMLAGFTDAVGPVGETMVDRAIVPARLFRLLSVIDEVLVNPA